MEDLFRIADAAKIGLVHHNQPFLLFDVDRECRAAASFESRMALCDGVLDVLGIEVSTTDDDQILDPAGHEELSLVQEAEIAGAQKRSFARIGESSAKNGLRFFGPIPITAGDPRG